MSDLPDWAKFVAAAVDRFGAGVLVTQLRLESVPGYELGESIESRAARTGMHLETYETGMVGFGKVVERKKSSLPTGWKNFSSEGKK